ncbi:MAG: MazG nucleotide pyrophosphohydrolase domain-containing protein [Candidatus Methanomethylicaceae archaeon]
MEPLHQFMMEMISAVIAWRERFPEEGKGPSQISLLMEEVVELVRAYNREERDEMARELADVLFVAIKMFLIEDLPLEAIHEVTQKNLEKLTGKYEINSRGKVVRCDVSSN